MKRITTMVISVLALALIATGCASVAQVAAAATPEVLEPVVLITTVPNSTQAPLLTPTIAPPTAAPTATPTASPVSTPSAANGTLELTLEQLKQYNGPKAIRSILRSMA